MNATLVAQQHVRSMVRDMFLHQRQNAVVVYDLESPLAQVLAQAYMAELPQALHLHYGHESSTSILDAFYDLKPQDLVVLIQSTRFQLSEFRLRMELFERELKVIEHVHLARMGAEGVEGYLDSLAYDPEYLQRVGLGLAQELTQAQSGRLETGVTLHLGAFEPAKHNIGDYSQRKNFGGQFPIGEVFTEARDLRSLHGKMNIYAYGTANFEVCAPPQPITLVVQGGRVITTENSTPEFEQVLQSIRDVEGEVWIRELGFGLNRAFTRERRVRDIGTYERMCGVHVSLGLKHPAYPKAEFSRRQARFHVDVFADTQAFYLDTRCVYREGQFLY